MGCEYRLRSSWELKRCPTGLKVKRVMHSHLFPKSLYAHRERHSILRNLIAFFMVVHLCLDAQSSNRKVPG